MLSKKFSSLTLASKRCRHHYKYTYRTVSGYLGHWGAIKCGFAFPLLVSRTSLGESRTTLTALRHRGDVLGPFKFLSLFKLFFFRNINIIEIRNKLP